MAIFNFTPSSIIADAILGLNLLTGGLTADVVGVFDQQNFDQLFSDARPMKAMINEVARVMTHPAESGVQLADHKVIDPRSIELMMLVDSEFFSSAFQQIRTAWLNNTLLIVQTNAAVYHNMIIQSLPREETIEKYDATLIRLQMIEVIYELPNSTTTAATSVSYYSPADPSNASQIARGLQSAIINPASSLLSFIHAASVWGIR